MEEEYPIDPEFLPKVKSIDASAILGRMDASAANQNNLSARSDKIMEEMREEQENCQETKQKIETFLDDFDKVIQVNLNSVFNMTKAILRLEHTLP